MLTKTGLRIFPLLLWAQLFAHSVAAQTPPDAGSLRQEIEKETKVPEPARKKESLVDVPTPNAKTNPEGLTVTVKSFRFEGNNALSDEQLNDLIAPFLNRPLTFGELETVLSQVLEGYKNAGWIARAFFPPQDIDSGSVEVRVVESRFGEARINGPKSERIESDRLLATLSKQLKKGELLSSSDLDGALRRINDLPGLAVTAVLAAGKSLGETDVLLNVNDGPMVRGNIAVDNFGSRFTGEERLVGSLIYDSPFQYGEQIITTVLHSEGTDYGQLAGTIPVGYSGLRLGAQASILNYEIVEGFDNLDANGESISLGLDASYPLIRSRKNNLSLSLGFTDTSFVNEANNRANKYSVNAFKTRLFGYSFDEYGGGGINQASLAFSAGDAQLDSDDTDGTLNGEGAFLKARYSLSRQQRVASKYTLYVALSGQFTANNLTSSEKFSQGGPSGLRAFTSTEGSGDAGHMLNLEFRMPLPRNFSVTAFYDVGHVRVDKGPVAILNQEPPLNEYTLQGAGLSGAWYSKSGFNVKATWASAIGGNALTDSNGSSSGEDRNHFWLQASRSF